MEKTPLAGTVLKILTVPVYEVKDFAAAAGLGNFDNDTYSIAFQFKSECVGLAVPEQVELVEFNRNWYMEEAIAWGEVKGKKPISVAHLMGIAIGLPDEQRERPIVELGSVCGGGMLCVYGSSDWRYLIRLTVNGRWNRLYLVGFVSEST